jgi:hypothetical protein
MPKHLQPLRDPHGQTYPGQARWRSTRVRRRTSRHQHADGDHRAAQNKRPAPPALTAPAFGDWVVLILLNAAVSIAGGASAHAGVLGVGHDRQSLSFTARVLPSCAAGCAASSGPSPYGGVGTVSGARTYTLLRRQPSGRNHRFNRQNRRFAISTTARRSGHRRVRMTNLVGKRAGSDQVRAAVL